MVIDYSERRQAQARRPTPNRPKVWPYVLLIILLLLVSFILGFGTGRHLYKPGGRFYKTPPQPQQPPAARQPVSQQPDAASPPATPPQQVQQQAPPAEKGAPPLTFYNTLQKGNKGLMGTGINTPKEGQSGGAKPQAPPPTGGN
jgi:hypothetical protein